MRPVNEGQEPDVLEPLRALARVPLRVAAVEDGLRDAAALLLIRLVFWLLRERY